MATNQLDDIIESRASDVRGDQPAVAPEEKVYRYQPKDDDGRPIGGAQVIKYHTMEELTDKLAEQNTLLVRKLREETRKNRLGISEEETISPDAKRFSNFVEFSPRELSGDERFQLSRDLLDPEKTLEAQKTLIEASFGASPEKIGSTLREIQEETMKVRAVSEAQAFVSANPDYFICRSNYEALTGWLVRYNLAPVKENFQRAYDTLRAQGVLVLKPELVSEPGAGVVSSTTAEPAVSATPVAPTASISRIPSGLTRDISSNVGQANVSGNDITYDVARGGKVIRLTGLAAVNAMPADIYGRLITRDPTFGKKVEKLEEDARRARVR